MKISLFTTSKDSKPSTTLTITAFIKNIREGEWKPWIDKIRNTKDEAAQKKIKNGLPAVTLAGVCNGRAIQKSSGYIGIDVDAADNSKDLLDKIPSLRKDPFVHAVWRSSRGNGLWLLFKINFKKHTESFLGIEEYLFRVHSIVADSQCKDNSRLCFVSWDADARIEHGKKVFKKLGKQTAIPGPDAPTTEKIDYDEVKSMTQQIVDARKDITHNYQDWVRLGMIYAELGSKGADLFNKISQFYKGYTKEGTLLQFNSCLKKVQTEKKVDGAKRANVKTLTYLMAKAGILVKIPKKKKRTPDKIEIVEGATVYASQMIEEEEGVYTFGVLEFKIVGKEKFKCTGVSTIRSGDYLHKNGVRRHGKVCYHIQDNIVKEIFVESIYEMLFLQVKNLPKGVTFKFDDQGEVITRDTVMGAALGTVKKVVDAIPINTSFDPDDTSKFLRDTKQKIYLKFEDTLVCITSKGATLLPYKDAPGLVWYKSIRKHKYLVVNGKSDVQKILERAIGGTKPIQQAYMTAIGYMLSTYFPPGGVPTLFCSDVELVDGINKGGNGKDFIKQVLSQFREVVTIPGKSLDLRREFSLHMGNKDTEIFWFEDLNRATKMDQFYNFSNGVTVRRLHTQAFTVQAKIGVSLQHTIDMEGSSNKRRQIFLLFQNYFGKLEHGIASEFGQIFGSDWNDKQRAQFNTFIIECCRLYLKLGVTRMDTSELSEARKEELGGELYSQLKLGTPYTSAGAMDSVQRGGMNVTEMSQKFFMSNWRKWCEHMNYDLEMLKTNGARYYTMTRRPQLRLSKKKESG